MGGQHDFEGVLSKTLYHMFYQGLFYMAGRGKVRKFRVDLEDRMEKELV